jgi:hypothetical protein
MSVIVLCGIRVYTTLITALYDKAIPFHSVLIVHLSYTVVETLNVLAYNTSTTSLCICLYSFSTNLHVTLNHVYARHIHTL